MYYLRCFFLSGRYKGILSSEKYEKNMSAPNVITSVYIISLPFDLVGILVTALYNGIIDLVPLVLHPERCRVAVLLI